MTWKAMSPDRVCDVVDFWLSADWPQTAEQVQLLGQQLGWTPDQDDMMENVADALSEPAVPIVTMPDDAVASLNFWCTDIVKGDLTDAGDAFLDDSFALLVREGNRRWGAADLSDSGDPQATWEQADRGRVVASRLTRSVTIDVITPQFAQVLRGLGE